METAAVGQLPALSELEEAWYRVIRLVLGEALGMNEGLVAGGARGWTITLTVCEAISHLHLGQWWENGRRWFEHGR